MTDAVTTFFNAYNAGDEVPRLTPTDAANAASVVLANLAAGLLSVAGAARARRAILRASDCRCGKCRRARYER